MLTSSSEYLKSLREDKYLLFLGWTDFLMQKYNQSSEPLNSDDAANFLIIEWLNNGFTAEDVKKIAILYAVYDLDSRPLRGKLDYSLKAITVASLLCLVFQKYDLIAPFYSKNQLTIDDLNQLIKQNITRLDPFIYKDGLEEMQTLFFHWVESSDKKEVEVVFQTINAITRPRYLLEDYILHLEQVKIIRDELHAARLSMAKRFLGYLYEQTEFTSLVAAEIAIYVNAIREMHPSKEEHVLLDTILPHTSLENTWRWVTGMGMSFFSMVLREKSLSELISNPSVSPES